MKRKIFIAVASILVSASIFTANAAESVRLSEQEDAFLITGSGYDVFQNIPILVVNTDVSVAELASLVENGANISSMVTATGEAVADHEGNVSYILNLGSETTKGVYKVYAAGNMYEVGFMKNSERLALVDIIVSAGSELASVLAENYQYLSIDTELYKSCSGANAIAGVLAAELSGSGLSSATENALGLLADMTDRAVLTVAANERKLTSFEEIVSKLAEAENTKTVSDLIDNMTESGKMAVLNSFQGCSFNSAEVADKRFAREIVLKSLCFPQTKTSTAILNILNNYNSLLGLELSGFNELSNSNRAAAIIKFSQENPSISNMQSVLDEIVSDYSKTAASVFSGGGGSGGGGSGGGGSGGGGSGGSVAASFSSVSEVTETEAKENTSVFSDLDETPWARDAILVLHAKGIINGYGGGVFAPQKSITREEFVKLVVAAYYNDASAESLAFDDVPEDAWYYESVAVAFGKGIIGGIDETTFGAGLNITRQDMAVILYRIAQGALTVKDEENRFDDDEMIADYAKTAVYALRDAGVINGVTDTEFAPQRDATRAETAVMLYRFRDLIN